MSRRRVLLVGATGAFGRRLARLLARDPALELVLAARTLPALEILAHDLRIEARASIAVARLDRTAPEPLAALEPWLVADAAGPFQGAGYELALAACRAGAHYVDLADGRDFVAGFAAAVAPHAEAAGVLAVTGASSTPALSHAALEPLVRGWREVEAVRVVISPGAQAPRGLSVVQAILSYAGRPVRVFEAGGWRVRPGWSGLARPELPGLGRRLASLCETPDLDLLPARFGVTREAVFLAGLEVPAMHLALWAMALVVRGRRAASLRPLAPPLRAAAGLFASLGSDRGGMIVEARGRDAQDRLVQARWALWAEAGAGPSTPASPAAALIRALARDAVALRGAHACAGLAPLEAIIAELAHLPIRTRVDQSHPAARGLFRRKLGPAFERLGPALQAVHDGEAPAAFAGRARVRAGRSFIARLLRTLLGLPRSGVWPLMVSLVPGRGGETWTRRFGTAGFTSRLHDTARLAVFEERLGPLRFAFRLDLAPGGVRWTPLECRAFGAPLPRALAPRSHARAWGADGRYRFAVAVAHPWGGLMFAYRGWLDPLAVASPPRAAPAAYGLAARA